MASSSIHIAVAKKFYEINNVKNKNSFLDGTLYPDSVENKDISHYTDLNRRKDLISHLRGKVNLYSFLLDHDINNSFDLGWFLHLITDYLFFEECFSKEYLSSHSFDEFRKDLYFAYDSLNGFIYEKYSITKDYFLNYPNEYRCGDIYKDCIFSKEMITDFIERVSSIDINAYVLKINKNKHNLKPY